MSHEAPMFGRFLFALIPRCNAVWQLFSGNTQRHLTLLPSGRIMNSRSKSLREKEAHMAISINTLAAKSVRTGEIAHGYLSDLVAGLRCDAAEAGDKETVQDCEVMSSIIDGSYDGEIGDDECRATARNVVRALRMGIETTVDADADGREEWDLCGRDDDGAEWRVMIDMTA